MKKTLSLLVAAVFASVNGFAAAQAAPAQSLVPSVQAAADKSKASAKPKAKAATKKAKTTRTKKPKAR